MALSHESRIETPRSAPMTDANVASDPQAAAWLRWLPWAIGVAAGLTALGVFVAPWLAPIHLQQVTSESQVFGFANRVAIVSLGVGALVMAAIGVAWRFGDRSAFSAVRPGLVSDDRTEAADWRLVAALMVLSAALFAALSWAYGSHPYADAAYIFDRLLQLVSGARFGVDFEFGYGPLLLYPSYWLWLATRGLGVSLHVAFYIVDVAGHLLGVAMAVYLVNRMRVSRSWKHALLLLVFAFDIVAMDLTLNYSPVRFLAPFVLVVWAVGLTRRGTLAAIAGAIVASMASFGVSPEMGVAASFGLTIALAMLAVRGRSAMWLAAAAVAVTGVAGTILNFRLAGSQFATFGAGSAAFPVVPGQAALLFVATILGLGLAVGLTATPEEWTATAMQTGWFATSLVLTVAALSRADSGHMFWNGLAAVLLAAVCLKQLWPKAGVAYLSVAFVTITVTTFAMLPMNLPGMFSCAVSGGGITKQRAVSIARHLGRSVRTGQDWYQEARTPDPTQQDIAMLLASHKVFAPFMLQGAVGERLAENHALVSSFCLPLFAMTPGNVDSLRRGLDAAQYVMLPRPDYYNYVKLATSSAATETPEARLVGRNTNTTQYLILDQYFLSVNAVHADYDSAFDFAITLQRDWTVDRKSGGYVILRRRP